jgi:glutaredoxin
LRLIISQVLPVKMRASFILRQQWSLRLTLFVRQNCSLCTDAKDVMSKVWDRRPFEYTEIDVMAANQTKWKNLYEFDTPVVRLKSDLNNNKQD